MHIWYHASKKSQLNFENQTHHNWWYGVHLEVWDVRHCQNWATPFPMPEHFLFKNMAPP